MAQVMLVLLGQLKDLGQFVIIIRQVSTTPASPCQAHSREVLHQSCVFPYLEASPLPLRVQPFRLQAAEERHIMHTHIYAHTLTHSHMKWPPVSPRVSPASPASPVGCRGSRQGLLRMVTCSRWLRCDRVDRSLRSVRELSDRVRMMRLGGRYLLQRYRVLMRFRCKNNSCNTRKGIRTQGYTDTCIYPLANSIGSVRRIATEWALFLYSFVALGQSSSYIKKSTYHRVLV
ncbi:hypothetical protein E2C01_009192 [Portunus trituberculatus]|uniref:Uncharacterized protein n=1 Tax=Portunus trituberculatus TaxID=210409 RepID=A0A5B7D3Z2_PORTR|nr:hypothetical protein [Portunus trituberculatus]